MITVKEYTKVRYEKFDDNKVKFEGSEERDMLKFPSYPLDVNYVEIPIDNIEGDKEEIVKLKKFSLKLLSTTYLENWLKTIRQSENVTKIKIREIIQTVERTEERDDFDNLISVTEKPLSDEATRWVYEGCVPMYKDLDDKNTWIIVKYDSKYDATPVS